MLWKLDLYFLELSAVVLLKVVTKAVMSCSDTYFLELTAFALLKVATKGVLVL